MKVSFKPLSLAIAVSAAAAGYAGTINAQELAGNTSLGDLAIVPYYTVRDDWTTGVSILNTSESTQVVKVRLRRATDSMDALDFNLVLSPNDVWTGYLENNTAPGEEDEMRFYTNDNSCTVPQVKAGTNYFAVPALFEDFAEEGYIEIIGMGATVDEDQPIAVAALHATETTTTPPRTKGVPANCAGLQNNFLRLGGLNELFELLPTPGVATTGQSGVVNSAQTVLNGLTSNFELPGNFMKVSWFIKDTTSGIEMGDNAVMIAGFMDGPSITNQMAQASADIEDLQGYDYPDLNGGAPLSALYSAAAPAGIGKYNTVRGILGGTDVINDWSKNVKDDLTVDTDWVVTLPGQYAMLNLPVYLDSITGTDAFDPASKDANSGCIKGDDNTYPPTGIIVPPATEAVIACDFRDLPVTITPVVFDREEQSETVPPDQIVISPTPPGDVKTNELFYEVNVIQWGTQKVLDAAASTAIEVDLNGAVFGWARLQLAPTADGAQAVCQYVVGAPTFVAVPPSLLPSFESDGALTCSTAVTTIPVVGFAAWQRNFDSNPDANYGRAISHSRGTTP